MGITIYTKIPKENLPTFLTLVMVGIMVAVKENQTAAVKVDSLVVHSVAWWARQLVGRRGDLLDLWRDDWWAERWADRMVVWWAQKSAGLKVQQMVELSVVKTALAKAD